MSWHYLQGLEEVSSEAICWDGERFAPSSGQTTLGAYCLPDSETEYCQDSQSGTMCRPLTENLGVEESMLSVADSLAKTFPLPVKEPESTVQDLECGFTWPGSFAKYDQNSCSWKTPQCSLLAGLDEFSETWPKWGMMQHGECLELEMSEDSTSETEYGFLPTPIKSDGSGGGCLRSKNGREYNLRDWWANKGFGKSRQSRKPEFWEWVMGWPLGWTELKPLEMGKFRSWLQLQSIF